MKKIIPINKTVLILILLCATSLSLMAQQSRESKSTEDLSFLVGKWEIVRIYSPDSDNERVLKGSLICEKSLDDQFIKCTYEIKRPGKIRGLDEVYFNYNSIYNNYESLWLSSTWPIKVLMQGTLKRDSSNISLNTSAQFQIENDIMENVKDELLVGTKESNLDSFTRKTFIRTSDYKEGVWHHHMTETANRLEK